MKCNQSHPGFELVSPCPFPTTITITLRAPPSVEVQLAYSTAPADRAIYLYKLNQLVKEASLLYSLPISRERRNGFMPFSKGLAQNEMQTTSLRNGSGTIFILNKSWRQQPIRHQLYSHLPPITKTIQVRRTRHTGHYWRSRDELRSDVLLWTPTYDRAKAGWPAQTYIQQLCEDTGCSPEDLPEVMNDREKWRERVRDIRACGTTWWWWWWRVVLFNQ